MRLTLKDSKANIKSKNNQIVISDEYYKKTFLSPQQAIKIQNKIDEAKRIKSLNRALKAKEASSSRCKVYNYICSGISNKQSRTSTKHQIWIFRFFEIISVKKFSFIGLDKLNINTNNDVKNQQVIF